MVLLRWQFDCFRDLAFVSSRFGEGGRGRLKHLGRVALEIRNLPVFPGPDKRSPAELSLPASTDLSRVSIRSRLFLVGFGPREISLQTFG